MHDRCNSMHRRLDPRDIRAGRHCRDLILPMTVLLQQLSEMFEVNIPVLRRPDDLYRRNRL